MALAILVTSAKKMDDETFAKHMGLRHRDSTGYLKRIPEGKPYLMTMWRAFHNQLHKFRIDLDHEHGRPL
jgi:hypothetical protein